MKLFSILLDSSTILMGAGVLLIAQAVLSVGAEFAYRTWRNLSTSWARDRLLALGVVTQEKTRNEFQIDTNRIVILAGFLILAVAVRDVLLSPLVLLIGGAIMVWANFVRQQNVRNQINEDAESVALQIRSVMDVDNSMQGALIKIKLRDGVMKNAMDRVAARMQMQQSPEQAAQVLKDLPGSVTSRLSALIANSSRLTGEVQEQLLKTLEDEAYRQKALKSKTQQTLALVNGTIRLLQAAVGGAIGFAMLYPDWRDFFLVEGSRRFLFLMCVAVVVLASFYFEYEVYQMKYGEG